MLKHNEQTGLLKSDEEYILKDVPEPNLLREQFPYKNVPRLLFDGMNVPMYKPENIYITDTTFRDGQQARPPYTAEQISELYNMLHKLGGPNGVIRQSEFFLYSDKDRAAIEKCQAFGHEYPEITGWIRAKKKDFELVKKLGLKETGILVSSSDYHIFLKLRKTRQEAFEDYLDVVRLALEAGVKPRCHLEDLTRADFYGFVVPLAQELVKLEEETGIPIRIRLCDTMGYGVPWAEAALPRSIPKLIYGMIHDAGVKPERLEWHGHNDFHKVLGNGTTAWLYGCTSVNGTLLGLGERAGNPPIEGLIIDYISLQGEKNGIDTTVITEIAEYFRDEIGQEIPSNYPFVGSDFNTTRAGIHADGVLKNEEVYNIFDTANILNRPPQTTITDKSGLAGIAHWLESYFELGEDQKIDKRNPGILKIYTWVTEQYDAGRVTGISDEEMVEQVKKHLPEVMSKSIDD